MKLEARTTQILKNFATINPSMLFRNGSTQSTVAPQKNILARAKCVESFPKEFAIFDLSRFLGVLSLFSSPELDFAEAKMTIKQGGQKVDYTFADPELIVAPSDKTPVINNPEVVFDLTSDSLSSAMKALGVLQSSHIIVEGDGSRITIGTGKPADPTSDQFRLEVGVTQHNFRFAFKAEAMKIIPGDYKVQISSKNIAHLSTSDVEYWIMADANFSSFS